MINILIQHSAADMNSGASHSLVGLVKQLKEEGKYNPIVVVPLRNGELQKKLSKIGIECYPIPQHDMWFTEIKTAHTVKTLIKETVSPIYSISERTAFRNLMIRKNIKLVHINMLTCGMAGQVAEKMGIPVIWHMREFLEEDIGVKLVRVNRRKRIINRAAKLIAISQAVKNKFNDYFTPNIQVIYNGIDFNVEELELNLKPILTNSKIKVAIVGRISKNKGQFDLVRALELLYKNKRLEYDLSIYGNIQEDNYMQKIMDFVNDNNAGSRIHYKGITPNTLVTLKNFDILAVCSNKEAFGRTTIEGMLSGCLVIGSASGGTNELIVDGKTGFKYRNHDTDDLAKVIERAVKNKELSREIAVNSQKFAIRNFSVKRNAEEIEKVYNEVLSLN